MTKILREIIIIQKVRIES